VHQRERSESIRDFMARSRRGLERLKPGVFIALVVTSVVGITGIVQWNQRLVIIGLLSGAALIAINIVAVLISHWHRRHHNEIAKLERCQLVVASFFVGE